MMQANDNWKKTKTNSVIWVIAVLAGLVLVSPVFRENMAWAQLPNALPDVVTPPVGDPRLEPVPAFPINLANFTAYAGHARLDGAHPPETVGRKITMRFPPRVNGQTHSNGDRHADLYVLFYANTGARVNQPFVLEAVPKGAAAGVSDLVARNFSAIWELHAVTVSATYNPNDLTQRIDSELKVFTSPLVQKIFQTNIFLNCPVVPNGSTVDPGSQKPESAFFEGQLVTIVPYDIEDGAFNPQTLFKFEDTSGNTLPSATEPRLIASRLPGDPFYSAIWEVWTLVVPPGTDVTQFTARAQFINPDTGFLTDAKVAAGWSLKSAGIRLNCPIVAMESVPGSGVMMPVPLEDAVGLLTMPNGTFSFQKFPFDIYPTKFPNSLDRATVMRTFVISEINKPGPAPPPQGSASSFPPVDPLFKDNVIPLILQDPFQLQSSGPNSTGPIIRFSQAELDAAYNGGVNPQLPPAIEANFTTLVNDGSLTSDWLPGGRPYQDRLALVGRAIFELVWSREQGAGSKDVSNCMACHSAPAFGGAARGLYNFQGRDAGLMINPGSMWGSGGAELLNRLRRGLGSTGPLATDPPIPSLVSAYNSGSIRGAHGSQGSIVSIRGVVVGAGNTHFGIQSSEFVGLNSPLDPGTLNAGTPFAYNETFDRDKDGVANEKSVGEVTAEAVFLMTLPVPSEASTSAKKLLRINDQSVQNGKQLFRRSFDNGGIGCAACHRVFHKMEAGTFYLTNPQTSSLLPLQVSLHSADTNDVADGLADFAGQIGVRTYGDVKIHKMGSLMSDSGNQLIKTAEVWDAGSVYPYLRSGSIGGADLNKAILAHEGAYVPGASISRKKQVNNAVNNTSTQQITITNTSGVTWGVGSDPNDPNLSGTCTPGSCGTPIRVILVDTIAPPQIQAIGGTGCTTPTPGAEGAMRQGAYWTINSTVAPGASVTLSLCFSNPNLAGLTYGLAIQDNVGYSQGVASTRAFKNLLTSQQFDILSFLRAQLISDKVAEGSGGQPPLVP